MMNDILNELSGGDLRSEEKSLVNRFGTKYKEYMETVPMLIPHKIRRKKKEKDGRN